MVKRVVILGKCGSDVDAKALKAVIRFVSDTQPDELVCIEQSIPLLEALREVYDGPVGVHASNVQARFGATALSESGYHIAPGWISTAKEDCVEVSRIAGNTALNAARKVRHLRGARATQGAWESAPTPKDTAVKPRGS